MAKALSTRTGFLVRFIVYIERPKAKLVWSEILIRPVTDRSIGRALKLKIKASVLNVDRRERFKAEQDSDYAGNLFIGRKAVGRYLIVPNSERKVG